MRTSLNTISATSPVVLRRIVFGNPILRQPTQRLSKEAMTSEEIRQLIANMHYTVEKKKYGVGLAAPQVGRSVALSVIGIKPTPTRPELEPFSMVLINPEIIATHGRRVPLWEGCISCGTGSNTLYAKVPRYKKVTLRWHDETAGQHTRTFEGFTAHVIQHEVDHLNGIVFVDRVKDPTTYMMATEYRKRIMKKGG
jgi:peptide deformylase